MDSTLNGGLGGGHSPVSPQTPAGGSAYRVNVKRTKTKKWVEAKVQSYDGDDWGGGDYDDDDDDQDEEPEPVPPIPEPLSHTGVSRDSRLPSLQTHHAVPGPIPVVGPEQAPSNEAAADSQGKNEMATSQHKGLAHEPGVPEIQIQTVTVPGTVQQGQSSSSARPSDICYRAKEQTEPGNQPTDLTGQILTVARGHARSDSMGQDENFHVASFPGHDQTEDNHNDVDHPDNNRRSSTSPKLPDVARMSAFGTDLFSSAPKSFSVEQPIVEQSDDSAYVGSPTARALEVGPPSPKPHNEHLLFRDSASQREDLKSPKSAGETVPPLRTPSPGASVFKLTVSPGSFEPQMFTRTATFDTAMSSPVKDNDMLSDEILRSLSPAAAPEKLSPAIAQDDSVASDGRAVRDINSNIKVYDNCWGDSEPKPKAPDALVPNSIIPQVPDPDSTTFASFSQSTVSPVDKAATPLLLPQSSTPRRRFSWEGEAESLTQDQPSSPTNSATIFAKDSSGEMPGSPAIEITSLGENKPPMVSTTRVVEISPQVSNSSSRRATFQQPVVEAPSPSISALSDHHSTAAQAGNGISLSNDDELVQASLLEDHRASSVEQEAALHIPPAAPTPQRMPQTMTLKEILSLGSSKERITKYNESRNAFYLTDSGLDTWLMFLNAQHSETSVTNYCLSAQVAEQTTPGANAVGQAGGQNAAAQQPYSQQYLLASSPNTAGHPTSRPRLGGLPTSTTTSGSTFGHSGNQIGTKSKEFMQSAGKMGKGLLSKGRIKLRGTGDKVFH